MAWRAWVAWVLRGGRMDPELKRQAMADSIDWDELEQEKFTHWELKRALKLSGEARLEQAKRQLEELTPEQGERARELAKEILDRGSAVLGGRAKTDDIIASDDVEYGPGSRAFDEFEQLLWMDLWQAAPAFLSYELRMEFRYYGPVRVAVVDDRSAEAASYDAVETINDFNRQVLGPDTDLVKDPDSLSVVNDLPDLPLHKAPMLNVVVGASLDRAVSEGHLEAALEWVNSLEVDHRVITWPSRAEGAAAEELLSRSGYEHVENRVRYIRRPSAPGSLRSRHFKIRELRDLSDDAPDAVEFGTVLAEGYRLNSTASFLFANLPRRDSWHCYLATDSDGRAVGAAATKVSEGYGQLAFAAVMPEARGQGCHAALLNRQIADAEAYDDVVVFAETNESTLDVGGDSVARRNLLRAGFQELHVRSVWRPSEGHDLEGSDPSLEEDRPITNIPSKPR